MNKIFFVITIMLLMCTFFSCQSSSESDVGKNTETTISSEETVNELPVGQKGKLTIDPNDYYRVEFFSLPEDFRQAAVDHMRKQASIKWVCSANFSVLEEWAHWGIDLDFKRGQTYYGIPYADTKVSYVQFKDMLDNGKYTSQSSAWKEVAGVQCVSSIMNSIQQFDPSVAGSSNVLMPSFDKFEAEICGEYEVPFGVKNTSDIISANSQETMLKAYSQLKKGDIIGTKNTTNGTSHYRMIVEDPVITTNASGKINPGRSYVKTIEQTNAFDKQRTDKVKTTWFVDHTYTFTTLRKDNYIPMTLEIYSKDISECEIPYILLDEEITASHIQKEVLFGSVKSNFPIRYVYIDVYNDSNQLVKRISQDDFADQRFVTLRKYSLAICDELEDGNYTLVITAGIAAGSAELARVDFTYSK